LRAVRLDPFQIWLCVSGFSFVLKKENIMYEYV